MRYCCCLLDNQHAVVLGFFFVVLGCFFAGWVLFKQPSRFSLYNNISFCVKTFCCVVILHLWMEIQLLASMHVRIRRGGSHPSSNRMSKILTWCASEPHKWWFVFTLDSVLKSQTWLLLFYSLVFSTAEVHTQLRMSKMSNPVITHQPGSGGYGTNVQTGEWSTGLCSCCTDFFVCECWSNCFKLRFAPASCVTRSPFVRAGAIGCFCPMILSCYTANKYGENCCLGCLPGGMTAIRTHMRLTYGIQVSSNCAVNPMPNAWFIYLFIFDDLTRMKEIFFF